MGNPFVKDDDDGVKYVAIDAIIKWSLIVVIVVLAFVFLTSNVPTMFTGAWGMVLLGFQLLGIFGLFIAIGMFIAVFILRKRAKSESDPWIRAQKQKTANWLMIAAVVLLVYSIIVWIIHILITIGYTATH